MSTTISPMAAADIPAEWIAMVRDIVARDGRALRAGESGAHGAVSAKVETWTPAAWWIEIKTITPVENMALWDPLRLNAWAPIMLPNRGHLFASREDRDRVLRQLQGEAS